MRIRTKVALLLILIALMALSIIFLIIESDEILMYPNRSRHYGGLLQNFINNTGNTMLDDDYLYPIFAKYEMYAPSESYVTLPSTKAMLNNMKLANISEKVITEEAADIREFAKSVHKMKPPASLQYVPNSVGIVLSVYKNSLLIAATNILHLLNSFHDRLNIEVWVDTEADVEWATDLIKKTCPPDLAQVRVLASVKEEIQKIVGPLQPRRNVRPFYMKLHAIMASSFQRLLFIDCDAFLVQNPLHLIQKMSDDKIPAATWLDSYGPEPTNPFFDAVQIPKKPGTGFESGIMYVDKKHSWDSLLVACRMNHRHQFYYMMFHGDKDLYYFAFNLTGRQLYYPKYVPGRLGVGGNTSYFLGGVFLQPDFDGRAVYIHLTCQKHSFFDSVKNDKDPIKNALIINGNKAHIQALRNNHYMAVCDNNDTKNCAEIISSDHVIGDFYQALRNAYFKAEEALGIEQDEDTTD